MQMFTRFWKQIAVACAALVALASGIAAYDKIRPYPTRSEFNQTAGRSCKNELSFYSQELRDIKRQIEQAVESKNTAWERTLREQRAIVLREIARVKRECGWS